MVLNIYHRQIIPIMIIIIGFTTLILSFIYVSDLLILFLDGLNIFIGFLMLDNPPIVVDENNIYLKNILGVTRKTYSYTLDTLDYKNNCLWVGNEKIMKGSWFLDQKSLKAFLDYLKKNKK